jgi:hypothetical protein
LTDTTNFVTGSVTEGDYRILDSGYTNACVLLPGSFPEMDLASLKRDIYWEAYADLFTRFVDDTSYTTFGTLRDSVFTIIRANRSLSAVYQMIGISPADEPRDIFNKQGQGPFWIMQRLRIAIVEFI